VKQYGWTEKKNAVNWAYMGVNDMMKGLGIDTTSKANTNVQLVQDQADEVCGGFDRRKKHPPTSNVTDTDLRNRPRRESTTKPSTSKPAS
jgi:hypothetical protein